MKKFITFLLKLINKVYLSKKIGRLKHQDIFAYLQQISIEGKSYGLAGDIKNSGEINTIHLVNQKFKNTETIIFDVGANKGQFQTELIEHLQIPDYHIYSFEPSPSTFELLTKSESNNISNYNIGFGERKESLTLYRTGIGSPLSSIHKKEFKDYYNVEMNESEEVQIETIDDFCKAHKIARIDLLKMDIEGHEFFALKGAIDMINKDTIKMIQFEFGPPNINSRTYLRDFYSLLNEKFRIYRIVKDGFDEINYSENEEIFLPINYLAISRKFIPEAIIL